MSEVHEDVNDGVYTKLRVAAQSDDASGVRDAIIELQENGYPLPPHGEMWAWTKDSENVRAFLEASDVYNHSGLRPVSAALGGVMPDMNTMLINFVSNLLNPPKNPEMLAEAEAKIDDPKAQGHGLPNNLQGSGKIEIS